MSDKALREFRVIEVTVTHHFIVEMHDKERTEVNGWTLDEVIKDWFEDNSIDHHHATRDTRQILGSSKLISSRIIDPDKENILKL